MTTAELTRADTGGASHEHQPRPGELWWMFSISVAMRIAVFVTITLMMSITVREFAHWWDGKSYLRMAQTFAGHPPPELRVYDQRVFPGFPLILLVPYVLGLPLTWAGLVINWICAGLSGVFAARLFDDRRMGWGVVTLTPQFLIDSSMVMTESTMMVLTLAGLLLARRHHDVLGGIMAGLGGLVRPMVCFSVIGQMIGNARSGRWRRAIAYGAAAAITVALGLAIIQWRTGDALQGPKVYATHEEAYGSGPMFDWPFHSLLVFVRWGNYKYLRLAYILLHVPLVLFACARLVVLYRRERSHADPLLLTLTVWLLGNTLFAACVGTHWALSQFTRLILVALPPLLWAYLPWLPRRAFGWVVCGLISYGFAVITFIETW